MKRIPSLLLLGATAALFCSCSDLGTLAGKAKTGSYNSFKARSDYKQTAEVYRNQDIYDAAAPGNTSVRIDLSDQRAQLLVGPDKKVAIDTPVCTGKAGKRTPTGRFPIQEKIADKRSNIFGTTYYKGRRVHGGDRRKYRGPKDKYVGASLPYWMRMTGDGIGMHGSSYVHRYPGSNGCVRTPHTVVDDIYRKVGKGSSIVVVP